MKKCKCHAAVFSGIVVFSETDPAAIILFPLISCPLFPARMEFIVFPAGMTDHISGVDIIPRDLLIVVVQLLKDNGACIADLFHFSVPLFSVFHSVKGTDSVSNRKVFLPHTFFNGSGNPPAQDRQARREYRRKAK